MELLFEKMHQKNKNDYFKNFIYLIIIGNEIEWNDLETVTLLYELFFEISKSMQDTNILKLDETKSKNMIKLFHSKTEFFVQKQHFLPHIAKYW